MDLDRKVLLAAVVALMLISGCARHGGNSNTSANGTANQTYPPFNYSANETYPSSNETTNDAHPAENLTLAPGDYDIRTAHDGVEREYFMHVPPSYDGSPTPVVIYFHGGGGAIDDSEKQGMYGYADKYGFILLSPAGTNRWGTTGMRTWNAGSWGPTEKDRCCGYAVEKNIDDVGFVLQMIGEVEEKAAVDTERIYATGHSNGGALAYRLACELAGTIAAAAPASPAGLEGDCSPSQPISIMHIHGTADPCVPYEGGSESGGCFLTGNNYPSVQSEIDFWLDENGCGRGGVIIYQKGNATCTGYSCEQGTEVEFCRVEGMGHGWPSGNPTLANIVGGISYDISFDQIWDFFQRHRRN